MSFLAKQILAGKIEISWRTC